MREAEGERERESGGGASFVFFSSKAKQKKSSSLRSELPPSLSFFRLYFIAFGFLCLSLPLSEGLSLSLLLSSSPPAHRASKKETSMASPAIPSTSTVDYKSERDVVDAYTRLRQELSQLADRVQDLEAQLAEHALVAKTMRPMEKGRKAYRLVSV